MDKIKKVLMDMKTNMGNVNERMQEADKKRASDHSAMMAEEYGNQEDPTGFENYKKNLPPALKKRYDEPKGWKKKLLDFMTKRGNKKEMKDKGREEMGVQ
jgi:hypothetical protein